MSVDYNNNSSSRGGGGSINTTGPCAYCPKTKTQITRHTATVLGDLKLPLREKDDRSVLSTSGKSL